VSDLRTPPRSNIEGEGAVRVAPLLSDLHSMGHHARQIGHDAATLARDVETTGDDLERYLTERVRSRPYSTIGAAAGLGYVLGGGLRTPLTVMLLGAVARVVTAQVVRELSGMAAQMNLRDAEPDPFADGPAG
jgi:F420-0:gamma-glutamyl ligase-like protein